MGQFSKSWEELNFSDNYIFCKVMKDKELCKEMLEVLLKIKVKKIEYIETEKQIENFYDSKGIRMDVYIQDTNRVIDLEMQTGDYDNLILRSRYYQSCADINSVPRKTRYKDLKEVYIVFICKDDPFGKGLYCYTKKTSFLETEDIPYDDKCHNVFYNASGFAGAEDKNVRDVLRFIYNLKANSDFTKRLEKSVIEAKTRGIMRDEYMYFQDILEEEKEEVREIGLAEGKKENNNEIAKKMLIKGYEVTEISDITGLSLEEISKIK